MDHTELRSACPTRSRANLLTGGCGEGKYIIDCRAPSKGVGDKPQIQSILVFDLGGFFKGKNKKAGINHCCDVSVTVSSFGSQHVSSLWFLGQVIHGSGVCELILPWRNNLSSYVNGGVYNSYFSTLTMLLTTAILVIWLCLISVQLAQDWGQRGQERE